MKKAIMATKIGMTQIFSKDGKLIPVTVLEAGPCVVVQKKTMENDGYSSIQVGFKDIKERKVNRPSKGHFAKAGVNSKKNLKELKLEDAQNYEVGSEIKADIFAVGDKVDVSGVSKGKGYAGVIKKYNQHRGPMGHGSKSHRVVGSMGGSATPSRVPKGKNLPSHMGAENVTVQNLEIVRIDVDRNLMLIKGALPGPRGSLLVIKNSIKA